MPAIFQQFITEVLALGWIDWVVTGTALIYVSFSARNSPWGWPFGILSSALWAYVSFFTYNLYMDALLQLFYVGMGFWGLHIWTRGGKENKPQAIGVLSTNDHLKIILIGSVVSLLFGYLFAAYTPAAATYWDAFTTVFSVVATFLLVKRYLENWIYWIIVDATYVFLYYSRGALLFAFLMIVYTIIAAWAYMQWKKRYLDNF